MHTSLFFRLFPPPKFMAMKYAGLDISDDAIHFLDYKSAAAGLTIGKYAQAQLPPGVISEGDIKDEKKLGEALSAFDREHDLSYVKISLPEEKTYLFQTDVPSSDGRTVEQNIEFKLEENVPLAAADAVFYFDLLPMSVTGGTLRASVSVVPRTYVERYIALLRGAGMFPIAFEVIPKSLARAIVPHATDVTQLIIYIMNNKTGIYIVSGGVVCFTSTMGKGSVTAAPDTQATYVEALSKEINRVYAYWMSHGGVNPTIHDIMLTGRAAIEFEIILQNVVVGASVPVKVANVWQNAFEVDAYVPPITREESLDYAVAAGLALPS